MNLLAKSFPNVVFVFGSNLSGIHGAGAAKTAHDEWGAHWKNGLGRQGQAWAIPTKDYNVTDALPISAIFGYVQMFLFEAENTPDTTYLVTAIGCGYAGYEPKDIAWMFKNAPKNVIINKQFQEVLNAEGSTEE